MQGDPLFSQDATVRFFCLSCCATEGFVLHLATRAALGPAVTLLPCVPEKVALTGQKKTFLQRQGSKEECVPAASALVTPLDNSRPKDPGFFDIPSKFSLTICKDSQMLKSYHKKLINSEE